MLLTLLLLAALTQDPAPRETASGFTFAMPKGWTRQDRPDRSVALVPPGAEAGKCTILILPGQENDLDAAAAHGQLFQTATQGSTLDGKIRTSSHGAWAGSQAKVVPPQGQPIWTAIYSTKTGRRFDAVLFVALEESLFEGYRPSVERMVGDIAFGDAAKPAAGTTVHGLVLPFPPTWTRKDEPSGSVMLVPPQPDGVRPYFLYVLPPNRLEGTRWESHKTVLKAVMGQVKWTAEPVAVHYPDAPGPFIRSAVAGKVAEGLQLIELYTALHDGVMETLIGYHGIDRNVTDPVLKAATFKDPPRAQERPRIVEAYRHLGQKLYVNPQGGAMTPGSLMYERIWLRADGVADFSSIYPEGYAASPLVFKVDAGLGDRDFGSWKAIGERIHILRGADSPLEAYERVDGGLRGGGKVWEPMPRVDGLKLSGRWGARSAPDQKVSPFSYWIEFTPEGKFSTEGGALTTVAAGDAERPKPPEKGSGTYEIRDWTIFFTFAGGPVWSCDFSTLGKDPKTFTAILLRTTVLSLGDR